MRIVKPSVTLLKNTNNVTHVAYCARTCRAGKFIDNDNDQRLFDNLVDSGHLSMLRHATKYFVVPGILIEQGGSDLNTMYNDFYNCPYVAHTFSPAEYVYLFSTNLQFLEEHPDFDNIFAPYYVNEEEFKKYDQHRDLLRYSFEIVTQIGTSRELNRTSPNSIVEQSTRYCNYNGDKFGHEVTICQPWWFDLFNDEFKDEKELIYQIGGMFKSDKYKNGINIHNLNIRINNYSTYNVRLYLDQLYDHCEDYLTLTHCDMKPQDARGVLPLDTATKVIYTYTVEEWKHIIDLRYYGTTGAPHPNAKIVANMIRQQLYDLGYTDLHK